MRRQQRRPLYFETETEEFYWEFEEGEAAELADRCGYSHLSRLSLRKLSGQSFNEPERNDRPTSGTSTINDVLERQGE